MVPRCPVGQHICHLALPPHEDAPHIVSQPQEPRGSEDGSMAGRDTAKAKGRLWSKGFWGKSPVLLEEKRTSRGPSPHSCSAGPSMRETREPAAEWSWGGGQLTTRTRRERRTQPRNSYLSSLNWT